ncbi:siderophore-interacting protein [Salinimonas lutimaris]|uniref:siderophore-interacting protein n=1 Tax=Salinimonas lutimaris TaxID=914153 RepID=UPI0010C081A5|nr:siderophore-interacting protein [Salinimonas lutimaris]
MTTWQQIKRLFSQDVSSETAHSVSLTVQKISQAGEHIRRITLGGAAIRKLPALHSGSHIQLLFDKQGNPVTNTVTCQDDVIERPFTVRFCDPQMLLLTIDIVTWPGRSYGPARRWAQTVQLGESIHIKGPWPGPRLAAEADEVLLAGEADAIPAIAHHLETLNPASYGTVILHCPGMSENIVFSKPPNVQIIWVNQPDSSLLAALQQHAPAGGSPAIWLGARPDDMATLKAWIAQTYLSAAHYIQLTAYTGDEDPVGSLSA